MKRRRSSCLRQGLGRVQGQSLDPVPGQDQSLDQDQDRNQGQDQNLGHDQSQDQYRDRGLGPNLNLDRDRNHHPGLGRDLSRDQLLDPNQNQDQPQGQSPGAKASLEVLQLGQGPALPDLRDLHVIAANLCREAHGKALPVRTVPGPGVGLGPDLLQTKFRFRSATE